MILYQKCTFLTSLYSYPQHLADCCHIAPNLVTQIGKLLEARTTDVIKLLLEGILANIVEF